MSVFHSATPRSRPCNASPSSPGPFICDKSHWLISLRPRPRSNDEGHGRGGRKDRWRRVHRRIPRGGQAALFRCDEFFGVSSLGGEAAFLGFDEFSGVSPLGGQAALPGFDELPGVSPEGGKQRCPWAWATVSALPLSQLDAMFPHGKPKCMDAAKDMDLHPRRPIFHQRWGRGAHGGRSCHPRPSRGSKARLCLD